MKPLFVFVFFSFIVVEICHAQFTVNFSANPLAACVGQPINFTDLSSSPNGIVSWVWDFGDGNSSSIQNPTHTYMNAGTYTVILTANNGATALSEVKSNYIVINPLPQPTFSFSNPPCSLPASINIQNVSPSSGASYQWSFGNGQTSSSQSPQNVVYSSEGSYNISLTVTNNSTGCTNSTTQSIDIFNYSSGFTYSPQTICAGTVVNFTNTSSPGTNVSNWNFGNGQTSSGLSPSAVFNSPGVYTVTLNSQNTTIGCSGQSSQTITVINPQIPSLSPSLTIGCNPSTISFTNTSGFQGSFSWSFGNGESFQGASPPPQTYSIAQNTASQSFDVYVYSVDANGCTSGQAYPNLITIYNIFSSFSVDQNDGCEILPVNFSNLSTSPIPGFPINSWFWDFGNGQTSSLESPPTQFYSEGVYNVSLTVSTANGCTQTLDSISVIEVGIPPTALFTVEPDTICARQTLTFNNQSWVSIPSNPSDFEYEWYIGSQGPYYLFEPNGVPITDTGSLDITLIVYFRGCPDTLVLENAVYVWGPLVQFSTPSILCNPLIPIEITISENSILGQEDDNVIVQWNLGDGTIINYNSQQAWQNNNQSFNHIYNNYGEYVIQQIIWNQDNGCIDSLSQSININYFSLDLVLENDSICVGFPVNFEWSYTAINDYPPFFYYYLINQSIPLGNSLIGNITNPFLYTFNDIGTHQITVGATNVLGCETTASQNIVVTALPNAFIGNINVLGCVPSTVVFTDGSESISGVPIVDFSWSFNGTTPSSGNGNQSFSAIVNNTGDQSIMLTVTDALGCSDSYTESFTLEEPIAYFEMPLVICNNSSFQPSNLSENFINSAWYWNGALVSTENNPTITIAHPLGSGTTSFNDEITLIVSDANGCNSTFTVSLLVSSPIANFTYNLIGANTDENGNFTCPPVFGMFNDASLSVGEITSWNWIFGDGKTSSLQNPNNTYVFAGVYTASLFIEDEYGCQSSITFDNFLTINGPSGVFSWQPVNSLCDPNYLFEVVSLNNVSQIEWFPGNSTSFTSISGGEYIFPSAGQYAPYVIITDENNCAVTYFLDTITVYYGNLVASFYVSPTELNWGVPLLIVNESSGGIGGIVNNNWTIGGDNFNNQSTQFSYLTDEAGNLVVTLVVIDSLGCVDSASLYINVTTELEFPNVFTPNGDGINDYFIFIANAYKEYEVVILNRWGNEVGRTYVINDDYLWDGKTQNGEMAKEGVYFYHVKGILRDGNPRQDHGFVHLVLE
jgi:gliding motility-associated-like protein